MNSMEALALLGTANARATADGAASSYPPLDPTDPQFAHHEEPKR